MILSIDTAENYCSAALWRSDSDFAFKREDIGRGHAERLIPMIEELLADAGVGYHELKKIAVTTGPGTFTGLRIGLSVARGLALALEVPCLGLSSLVVLASQTGLAKGPVHAVLKGRGGQVFYQPFEGVDEHGRALAVGAARNIDAEEAAAAVEAVSGFVVGSGVPLILGREITEVDALDPVTLARLAAGLEPQEFPPEPFYLRDADAVRAKPVFEVLE